MRLWTREKLFATQENFFSPPRRPSLHEKGSADAQIVSGRRRWRTRIATINRKVSRDRQRMQARQLSPLDVMETVAGSNVFLPTGALIVGD